MRDETGELFQTAYDGSGSIGDERTSLQSSECVVARRAGSPLVPAALKLEQDVAQHDRHVDQAAEDRRTDRPEAEEPTEGGADASEHQGDHERNSLTHGYSPVERAIDPLIPPTVFDGDAADPAAVEAAVLRYVENVLDGSVVANVWIKAACRRFLSDLERTDIRMDWNDVAAFVTFCGRLELTLSHAGKRFELLPWQLWCSANLYGWRKVVDGTRRIEFAVVQVARKAGKSTWASAIGLYEYRLQERGNRVHVIANTVSQSRVIMSTAAEMVRRTWPERFDDEYREYPSPHLKDVERDARFDIIVAKDRTLDGLNPSCWIGDEASEWRGRFITKLRTAQGARVNPLGVIITTPGDNKDLIYTAEILPDAYAALEGRINLDSAFYALYGLDEEDDPGEEALWEKANPGLPYGQPRVDWLRRQWLDMERSPVRRAEFCRFHGARFAATANRWLDLTYWDEGSPPVSLDELRGRPAWVGVDLSAKHDLTAVVAVVPLDDGRLAVIGRYWWPEHRARDREMEYGVPLRRWVAERRVMLVPGDVVDYGYVREALQEFASTLNVRGVAYDRWNASQLAHLCANVDRLPMVEYDMSNNTFVPGCAVFERLWLKRRLVHGNDPILRRACADAGAKEVSTGQHRLVKAHRFALIDPLVSLIYATHLYSETEHAKPMAYSGLSEIVI